jgi:hypothetical protein
MDLFLKILFSINNNMIYFSLVDDELNKAKLAYQLFSLVSDQSTDLVLELIESNQKNVLKTTYNYRYTGDYEFNVKNLGENLLPLLTEPTD